MSTERDSNMDMAAILIVDDESANLKLLSEILGREGYRVRPANSPKLAIDSALGAPPDLILLDVKMPEMDGFEVCTLLKQDERTRDIPILFISALQDTKDKVRAFKAGGVDFITKPFQEEEILARVRTHMRLRNMQRNLEELVAERTAELSKSEQLARSLLDATTDFTQLLDEDGIILDLNDAIAERLGGTREELIGTCVFDRFTPEVVEKRKNIIRQALASGEAIHFLDRLRPGFVYDAGFYPIATPAGEKDRIVIYAHDITEREQFEQELQKGRDYLEHLINSIPDAVFSVKLPDRTIEWARDSYNVLGHNLDDFIGEKTERLYSSVAEYQTIGKLMETAIRNNEDNFIAEALVRNRNGEPIPVEINTTIYREKDEPVSAISLVRDISKRKSREHQIQIYQQRLKALAAKLTMSEEQERRRVAAVLHDNVGQSLTFARLQLASAKEDAADPTLGGVLQEVSDTLLAVAKETRRLIFDLSSPAISELGLPAAIKDWMDGTMARHGIAVELIDHTANDDTLSLSPDTAALLFRHAKELLTNVIKHARADRVTVHVHTTDDVIEITVEDNGVGFEMASSEAQMAAGHFGLFSIEEGMADIGGTLEIQSNPGKGCRAMLRLPIQKG